jgi:hypothetical protein
MLHTVQVMKAHEVEWYGNGKHGNKNMRSGPHKSRSEALEGIKSKAPKSKSYQTGYGYGGGNSMQWHKPGETLKSETLVDAFLAGMK